MKNAEWMIEQGMEFPKLTWGHINGRNIVYYDPCEHFVEPTEPPESAKELYSEKSANTENLILKWLDMEHKEPILDEVEKRYLKSVIKPFRDRVEYIEKVYANIECKGCHNTECKADCYIFIKFTDKSNDMNFPSFHGKDMYKGMELYNEYTLEELGL